MNSFTLFLKSLLSDVSASESMSFWQRISPPEDISTHGHLIDWLFMYTTVLNLFFFTLVCIGLFGFSYLYYYKRHPVPYYTYGNKKAHILVATIIGLAVFLSIDLNITRISNNDYTGVFINFPDEEKEDVVRIQVMAQQWAWEFRYAGKDGVFNTEDDVVLVNDLRLPVDRKVVFQMTSKDVIHSLFFPNARLKTDAIPGRITRMWFELTKPGEYDIACAEMCGVYHYRMQARLRVYEGYEFDRWLEEAQEKAIQEADPGDFDRFWGWAWIMDEREENNQNEVTMR